MSDRLSLKSKVKIVLISLVSISLIGISLGLAINLVIKKVPLSSASEKIMEAEPPTSETKEEESIEEDTGFPGQIQITEYPTGKYRVGEDIPPGSYKLFARDKHPGFYRISKSDSNEYRDILYNDIFIHFTYIEIEDGQYLTLTDATATEEKTAPSFTAGEEGYHSGKYLVGKDIPEGSYIVYPEKDYGYIEISSSPLPEDTGPLLSKYLRSPYAVTLSSGQFIKLSASYIK